MASSVQNPIAGQAAAAEQLLWIALRDTLIQQYITVTARTIFIFYWIDHLREEVTKIWSGRWTTGSILFVVTTYSLMARTVVDLFVVFPTAHMTAKSCWDTTVLVQALNVLQTYAPTGSILLCLHALLGAKKKYLVVIATGYALHITLAVILITLWSIGLRAQPTVYPSSKFTACMFIQERPELNTALTYANVARETVILLLGVTVVYTRYRGQKTSLISTVRRDGAIYLICAFTLGLVAALLRTPGFPIIDRYGVIQEMRTIAYPILANRLLLNLRYNEDYQTRTAVSVLLFERERSASDPVLDPGPGGLDLDAEGEGDSDESPPMSAKATGGGVSRASALRSAGGGENIV